MNIMSLNTIKHCKVDFSATKIDKIIDILDNKSFGSAKKNELGKLLKRDSCDHRDDKE